mmetsp:Transcript_12556/g.50247  ORF Transcript_12556/g.50247 Transcript_12556/m.50247 type:complete len:210 (-) Transcript_12556:494-1123(-)
MQTAHMAHTTFGVAHLDSMKQCAPAQVATKRTALTNITQGAAAQARALPQGSSNVRKPRTVGPTQGGSKHVEVHYGGMHRLFDNMENTDPSSVIGTTIFNVYPCLRCHSLIQTGMKSGAQISGVVQCSECGYGFCFHCELARANVYGKGQRRCPEHRRAGGAPAPAADPHAAAASSKARNTTKEVLKQRKSSRRLLSPKKRQLKKRTLR